MRVTNAIPLGSPLPLTVTTVNYAEMPKVPTGLVHTQPHSTSHRAHGTVRVFCCVRVRVIGLRLLCGARFPTGVCTLDDAIGFHTCAPLEALAGVRAMAFISGVTFLPVDTV